MQILLKLYRCFCHDLKICMWFGYYPEIIFCHFFCNLNLVIFKCTIMAGDINSLNLLVWKLRHFMFPINNLSDASNFLQTFQKGKAL